MARVIMQYTMYEDRSGVWEGTFEETDDINVGDYILTHHCCMYCHKPLLDKVIGKKKAYSLEVEGGGMTDVFDLEVEGGGAYKSNLKLISSFDQLIFECDMKTKQPYNFTPVDQMTLEQLYYEYKQVERSVDNELQKREAVLEQEINRRQFPNKN